ncbi:MAG: DNA-processing protein DprA [Myxococcota bacterium]
MLERLDRLEARLVPLGDSAYPSLLEAVEDAPLVLSVRGVVKALSTPSIGIVGARAATREACAHARRLGRELASAGLTVVSGLARGIDAEAHRGAMEGGGRTVAVLACGIDQIYPPEHRGLAKEIVERGAVISELPLGAPPRRTHFPLRNRIISGLSRGVIVVEARRRSGSLITVRHALSQGREVFVVPGAVSGPFSEGTNQLLRDGARPVRNAEDVMEDLGIAPLSTRLEAGDEQEDRCNLYSASPDPLARNVMKTLAKGPLDRQALLVELGVGASDLGRLLFELHLLGWIEEERDGRIHARLRSPGESG